jgi:hypothetical protein
MSHAFLQRCACGGTLGPDGECAACKAKRHAHATSLVGETLGEGGRPLEAATRAGFERATGHDFGSVRVHTGERAARSAKAVGAHAYTVGRDVVFGADRYDPGSEAGRRLLAHELTHVRQQAGATPSGPLRVVDVPAAEAEADRAARTVTARMPVALQRQPDRPHLLPVPELRGPPPPMLFPPGSIRETYILPAPPEITLSPPTLFTPRERFPHVLDTPLVGPAPFTPAIFISVSRCVPDRPLDWSDFQGAPGAGFGAFTSATAIEENVQGNVMFRAVLNNTASWVKPEFPGAGSRATNLCAPLVTRCQSDLAAAGAGATWSRTPGAGCAASVFTPAQATNANECDTVVGAACDADAIAESARLLAHEQGHFDIACKLVGRADDALAAGTALATVRTWLNTNLQPQNTQYDGDTGNGCNAAQQAAWLTRIAGGLPAVVGP